MLPFGPPLPGGGIPAVVIPLGGLPVLVPVPPLPPLLPLGGGGGIPEPPLFQAIQANDMERVNQLLDEGANINKIFKNKTPLFHARRNLKMFKLLLDRGANPNHSIVLNGNYVSMVMVALDKPVDASPLLSLLLEHGANPNGNDGDYRTPLAFAAGTNNPDLVLKLLDAGADVDHIDTEGNTVLVYVLNNGDLDMAELLLENGASPFINDTCRTEPCQHLLAKYQWAQIQRNIKSLSRQYSRSGDLQLPREVWSLILLRQRQKLYCQTLSRHEYTHLLQQFASYLDIPVTDLTRKSQLCDLISKQLSYGGGYSENSVRYFKIRENREKVLKVAASFGIDISQTFENVLDDIAEQLRI